MRLAALALGILSWLAGSAVKIPYQVNPVTILECQFVGSLLRGGGIALVLAAALLWYRRKRIDAWRAAGGNRRLMRRLALLLAATCLALGAAETALRLLPDSGLVPFNWGKSDPIRHHRLIPEVDGWDVASEWRVHIRTNRLGLRGPELSHPQEGGRPLRRILVLGDSYTEGYGVEEDETFCSRLGPLISPSGGVEVLNAGCGSYSPLLEWAALQDLEPQVRPDLVLLALDPCDLQDDLLYSRTARFSPQGDLLAVSDGHSGLPTPENTVIRMIQPLKHARVYERTKSAVHRAFSCALVAFRLNPTLPAAGDLLVDRLASTRPGMRERLTPDLARTEGYLCRIRDLCQSRGVPFAIVTYPYPHQLNGREWPEGRLLWGFLPGETYDPWLCREIAAFGEREGIPVIDLTEDLRASPRFPLHYARDGHWNANGHTAAAEGIAKGLKRLGLDRS